MGYVYIVKGGKVDMLKKKSVYIGMIIAGCILVALSGILKGLLVKQIIGIMMGVGASFVGAGVSSLWMKIEEEKNPELKKGNDIIWRDERNVLIRNKARAMAGEIMKWGFMVIAYLLILIDAPLWMTLISVGAFMAYYLLTLFFTNKYNNEM